MILNGKQVIAISQKKENESVKKTQMRKFDTLIQEKENLGSENR